MYTEKNNKIDKVLLFSDKEKELILQKVDPLNQLGFAAMLIYYKRTLSFPGKDDILVPFILNDIAINLGINPKLGTNLDMTSRTIKRYRKEIRDLLGFRVNEEHDITPFIDWMERELLPQSPSAAKIEKAIINYYKKVKIDSFSKVQEQQFTMIAQRKLEERLFDEVFKRLTMEAKGQIDQLLKDAIDEERAEEEIDVKQKKLNFNSLKKGVPGIKLKNIELALQKHRIMRGFTLSEELKNNYSRKLFLKYHDRIMSYYPSHIEELEETSKYAMLAIFCHIRAEVLGDELLDLFIKLIKKIKNCSKSHVDQEAVAELNRVEGKLKILYELANASVNHPRGVIKDKIYSVVAKEKLVAIKEEMEKRGTNWYQDKLYEKMGSLYVYGKRKELLSILKSFKFFSHNEEEKPLLAAISLIIEKESEKDFGDAEIPIEGVIPDKLKSYVVDKKGKITSKHNYELIACETICEHLSYKGIWSTNVYKYRDPREDLPKDFAEKKKEYCESCDLEMDATKVINELKESVKERLSSFNETIVTNDKVKIVEVNGKARIKVTPYKAQEVPEDNNIVQKRIGKRWGNINLIDILKESDLRIGFNKRFVSVGKYSSLRGDNFTMKLLLSLYGIGSNTGLKRISVANPDITESDLRYIKQRFINATNVRMAIRDVVNAVISIRNPEIWGTATTSISCDSKRLDARDQNLVVDWHSRYKKTGIMVYWHVDTNALCVYSQVKTPLSSEVGSMLKGVLRHSSEMDLDSVYVDTHGQSTIGFGVSKLLNFKLLPRLKNINKRKLYAGSVTERDTYKNLSLIIKDEPIRWNVIEKHYEEVLKNIVALKTGLMEPEVFVKRFSRDNYKDPVYKAMCEIGKAEITTFLCDFLEIEAVRVEIGDGLNVVERLNGVLNFFFYGKKGEIGSNDPEEQELSILCLHLLQACSVYINTLLIQEVLGDENFRKKLTKEDYRALTPLIHSHLNPYGTFMVDLKKRLIINKEEEKNEK